MIKFTEEQLAMANTPEELLFLAKRQGADITLEQATASLKMRASQLVGEMLESEMDNIAGGAGWGEN